MAEVENHFTVFIRLPFARGDFVDPPPVEWSASKERELWEELSKSSKGHEVDWRRLSEKLNVTQAFLLQQAAWLYERQLSQVRAQMRKIPRTTGKASPTPLSVTTSTVGSQPMKRTESGGSRAPSRLATTNTVAKNEPQIPATPATGQTPVPIRTTSATNIARQRADSSLSARPPSRRDSRDHDASSRTHSRRGSVQQNVQRSPRPAQATLVKHESSSEDEILMTQSRMLHRRPNPAPIRRINPTAKPQQGRRQSLVPQVNEDDEDDKPAFLPFSNTTHEIFKAPTNPLSLQTQLDNPSSSNTQPSRSSPQAKDPAPRKAAEQLESSTEQMMPADAPRQLTRSRQPLSAQQQAALAVAAGLSPRIRRAPVGNHGSDTSPSMGSSFSDLDDASVTQSALEEALLSGMGNTTMTVGGPSVASRVSGISQALKSRYFDAKAGESSGGGQK